MNVMEVAVYAMVIGGQPQAYKCVDTEQGTVNCTSGLSASRGDGGQIRFSNGVVFDSSQGRFSNGITVHRDSAGWLEFSNGASVHSDTPYRFRFSNGFVCQLAERGMVECQNGR